MAKERADDACEKLLKQWEQLQKHSDGGLEYFQSRGISPETCEQFGLFQSEGRAWFPVWENGELRGLCGRAISDQTKPRYKNSSGPMGLWNGDRLREQGGGRLLFVTEGILDALQVIQLGEAAVALCGSQNTGKLARRCGEQLRTAASWRFVLCGDPDAAGRKMNAALAAEFDHLGLVYHVLELSDGDLAETIQRDPEGFWEAQGELGGTRAGGAVGEGESVAREALQVNGGAQAEPGPPRALGTSGPGVIPACEAPYPVGGAGDPGPDPSHILACGDSQGPLVLGPGPGQRPGEALQRGSGQRSEVREMVPYTSTSAAAALDDFFRERERRAATARTPTGFGDLDRLLGGGLYPGLYILGAISSLGKTSLALQMADTIALHDRDVLFISLEQSRFELMAKSLSRISAELAPESALTARQLMTPTAVEPLERRQLLEQCRELYGQTARGLFLREGIGDIGPGEIRRMVQEHLMNRGQPPVLVVDYLQILRGDPRSSDKQNTDRAVVELKRLSRDFDIPVLCISSFNRENYRTAVSMEAFKESGVVEYSADVLLGLQLLGAGGRDFDANAAKLREPRQLELVILKNRSGVPYAKLRLDYDARFSRFTQGRQLRVKQVG